MNFWPVILEPWTWSDSLQLYWPILVEGMLVSVALGLIGCFLVVRGLSLLGDALSHSVLPGIVIGFLIGGSLHSPWILVGATLMGLLAAMLVQTVHSQSRVKEDASLGIVFTGLFALGVLMINLYAGQADLDPGCVLYGNIEHFIIQPEAIWPMAGVLGVVLLGLLIFYRHLLVSTFDPGLATSLGINATVVHYALMGVLSLAVVTGFEAVGAILAVALLIIPGATARLWTDRMSTMLLFAAGHGITATAIGYWLSHPAVLDTSASGAISVAGFGLFLVSWLLSPKHGLLMQAWLRYRLNQLIRAENLLKTVEEMGRARAEPGVAEADLSSELRMPRRQFSSAMDFSHRRGWIARQDGRVTLTPAGIEEGRRLIRAHETWEQYLQQEVGLEPDHVHDAAEWIEHHLSDEKIGRIQDALKKD